MILETIAIVAGAGAVVQVARKGVPVSSGEIPQTTGSGAPISWRARWAFWRWIAEVKTPTAGWSVVGEFKTRELAESQAKAAAATHAGVKVARIAGVKIR